MLYTLYFELPDGRTGWIVGLESALSIVKRSLRMEHPGCGFQLKNSEGQTAKLEWLEEFETGDFL